MQMVMTSDETQIQILANWPILHAKRVTRNNRKNPEYHIAVMKKCIFKRTNKGTYLPLAYSIWRKSSRRLYWLKHFQNPQSCTES